MEDRRTPGLWLERCSWPAERYAAERVPAVLAAGGVTRSTWWANQHRDRDDVPRRLDEFDLLGVHELDDGFAPPLEADGIEGLWFAATPRPGQGSIGGETTNGLVLVLISPRTPDEGQALRDWGDFVHIRHIAEAGVPGYRMITPYENVAGPEAMPRYLHFYEMASDDPEATYKSMTPLVQERIGGSGTEAYEGWAWHPALRIDYVNTFALLGEAVP